MQIINDHLTQIQGKESFRPMSENLAQPSECWGGQLMLKKII